MANRRIGGAGGGSDKAGGGLAVVGVAAVALGVLGTGAAGTTAGVVGTPVGSGVGAGSSAGSGVSSGVGSSAGESISVRKADGKKSARKGDSDAAWRRLGMKELKKQSKKDLECLSASFDQVQEFLIRTPCASLDRMLFAVGDGEGNSAVVSVVWVGFRTTRDVTAFKRVVDRQGSGDIRPLATPLLELADIHFSGLNYGSETTGKGITIAETETASGTVAPDLLDALAEVAALLPRP